MTTYYRFDRFELRPARRQLLEDGVEIDVGGRAFDLLVALVERRDRIVTRDELYSLVWPNVSVELNNLHVQIWRLRNRLGDQSIRTIARQGYQFVADVEAITQPATTTRVPSWFEPLHRDDAPTADAPEASDGARLDHALRRHRVVAFIHDDDAQRRQLLDSALAALPPARRSGTLHYDAAELLRRPVDGDGTPPPAGDTGPLPGLRRAAARAQGREQLLVLHDAHLAPALVASIVDAVLGESPLARVILGVRAPLGLQDEHALIARAIHDPGDAPESSAPAGLSGTLCGGGADTDAHRPLRWRSRGTPA